MGGHEDQYGTNGNYYKRGLQMGKAIHAAWPKAKVIIVYAFGYAGESWWYRGLRGRRRSLHRSRTYLRSRAQKTRSRRRMVSILVGRTKDEGDLRLETDAIPVRPDNQHVNAGLFPIDFGAKKAITGRSTFANNWRGPPTTTPGDRSRCGYGPRGLHARRLSVHKIRLRRNCRRLSGCPP